MYEGTCATKGLNIINNSDKFSVRNAKIITEWLAGEREIYGGML